MTKQPARQPEVDTIESLLDDLRQTGAEKNRIKEALAVRRDELKKMVTMIDSIMDEKPYSREKAIVLKTLGVFVFAFVFVLIISAVISLVRHKEESMPIPAPTPNIVVPVPDVVVPIPPVLTDDLIMTEAQARLTKQAIEVIRDDVEFGQIRNTELVTQALSALLPSSVRQRVLEELGTPDIEFMRDALDILDGRIVIQK